MKSQRKNSSQLQAETSFFGTETQQSRLSEDDDDEEEEKGRSDEEQASGEQKRTEVDEPVKAARKKKKGVKRKSEGKSSFNLFRLLAVLLWFSDGFRLTNYFCETDTEPEKSEEDGIQWMSSQDTAKDPKKESKDKLSLKRIKQLHQEKV